MARNGSISEGRTSKHESSRTRLDKKPDSKTIKRRAEFVEWETAQPLKSQGQAGKKPAKLIHLRNQIDRAADGHQ
jgi:hypothetical protein